MNLRGHHLICLHFFRGEGYDAGFIANLKQVLEQVEAGEPIEVVEEADAVCLRCRHLVDGACTYQEGAEAEIARLDWVALHLLGLRPRQRVTWQEVGQKLPSIFERWRRFICVDCNWKYVCQETEPWKNLAQGG